MGSVTDRFATDETDHLWRLVHHPSAIGNGQRKRAILANQHLDAGGIGISFGKSQELGPSSG